MTCTLLRYVAPKCRCNTDRFDATFRFTSICDEVDVLGEAKIKGTNDFVFALFRVDNM